MSTDVPRGWVETLAPSLAERLAPYARYVVDIRTVTDPDTILLIDRRTCYGNWFVMRNDSEEERLRVIACFTYYLLMLDPEVLEVRLKPLREHLEKGGVFACWCAPRPCHGQVWAAFALRKTIPR